MNKNIEIITLIYKSTKYLNFIISQLTTFGKAAGWDVGIRIIANDATDSVLEHLEKSTIPYSIFNNSNKNEYYINRVYRGYNYGVVSSNYDNVCLVNSDNGFNEYWLSNLLKYHDGVNIPCSRLIESGKMLSGKYGVSNNFGRTCDEFENRFDEWLSWSENFKEDKIYPGGLYMPAVFEKRRFIEAGMYPEGNIYSDGKVGSLVGGVRRTADEFFFNEILAKKFNMKHVTVFNSLSYHIQEGEKSYDIQDGELSS